MSASVEEFNRFARLFPEPILLLSNAGHLCAANTSARSDLFANAAVSFDELILNFVAEPQDQIAAYLRACSRSAQPLPGSLTFLRADGTSIAFRCFGCAFQSRDERQRPLVILRFVRKDASTSRFVALNQQIAQLKIEIARRVDAERRVQENRELLQVTLASIGDAVIATDVCGLITFMNAVAEAHTGYTQQECLGRPLEEVFVIRNEYTGEPAENPLHKVIRTGTVVGLANHTVLIRRDGAQLPIDDSAAPIRDASGRLFGVILVFHEVSESRKLQHELLRQTEALKEADRRKDEFLAVLAHELRNPLAPLRNGLQILRMSRISEPKMSRAIDMMDRQLVHLVRLVDDLMDMNRVSRGVIELRRTPLLITDVLARSIEAVRADLEKRGHHFRSSAPGKTVAVLGDADRLTQIFSNLLTNSAKYSPDNGSIELNASVEGSDVVVRVRDEGVGIPPDQLDKVFEMFSQVRTHQERSEGGLGIGLSLVRTLVEMHGGTVAVHSAGIGTGSTFTVRLPTTNLEIPAAIPESPVREPATQSLRIIVADDNADAANSLRLLLEFDRHEVRTAATGREVLGLVESFEPALIFMDVGMPDLDGNETTRLIRERLSRDDLVIVALTGWGQPQDRERTALAGVDRHVVKPISPQDVAEIISFASGRRRS